MDTLYSNKLRNYCNNTSINRI